MHTDQYISLGIKFFKKALLQMLPSDGVPASEKSWLFRNCFIMQKHWKTYLWLSNTNDVLALLGCRGKARKARRLAGGSLLWLRSQDDPATILLHLPCLCYVGTEISLVLWHDFVKNCLIFARTFLQGLACFSCRSMTPFWLLSVSAGVAIALRSQ